MVIWVCVSITIPGFPNKIKRLRLTTIINTKSSNGYGLGLFNENGLSYTAIHTRTIKLHRVKLLLEKGGGACVGTWY